MELPFLHADLFREHQLRPPKGILLYGPPGCGKTLIAKAVANSLAKKIAERRGEEKHTSYFLNIKGPELLNKYVGETERHIRLIFQRAREKAGEGTPVIVFFDEMDSVFRTRGSGVSSDVENTIVPQLLSEIDGVEGLENVIVIGASNREDMIDPAILRPGRLDVKIKIERPDAEAAKDIFTKYILTGLPLHADDLAEHGGDAQTHASQAMIEAVVLRMYSETEENRFLEVTYANGDKEVLYFKDFNSGAMIQNIVDRGKKMAIKEFLASGRKGLRLQHLLDACVDEFRENEDLPNTTNPDDWARISGKKGERIVYIRTLVSGGKGAEAGRVHRDGQQHRPVPVGHASAADGAAPPRRSSLHRRDRHAAGDRSTTPRLLARRSARYAALIVVCSTSPVVLGPSATWRSTGRRPRQVRRPAVPPGQRYVVPMSLEQHGSLRRFWIGRLFRIYPRTWRRRPDRQRRGRCQRCYATRPSAASWPRTMLSDPLGLRGAVRSFWTLPARWCSTWWWPGCSPRLHRHSGCWAAGLAATAVLAGPPAGRPVVAGLRVACHRSGPADPGRRCVGVPHRTRPAIAGRRHRFVLLIAGQRSPDARTARSPRRNSGLRLLAVMFAGTVVYRAQHGQLDRGGAPRLLLVARSPRRRSRGSPATTVAATSRPRSRCANTEPRES